MIYYLNLGFVLEQALQDILKRYIDRQKFDEIYGNFHISVVNEHPFAHLIIDNHAKAQDSFPSIVVTTQSDSKPSELANVPPQVTGVGFSSKDIDELISKAKRVKTKINEHGEVVPVKKNGVIQMERMPGFILVYDAASVDKLKQVADSRKTEDSDGYVYGIKSETRRRDRVSIEIWAENNQLKNELYEHIRLLLASTMNQTLSEYYSLFMPTIFDNSVNGERSSNFNFDFDCLLCGSHISFEVDYTIAQIILDTEVENTNYELITEVINHVKTN